MDKDLRSGDSLPNLETAIDLQTRYLCPFYYARNVVKEASEALCSESFATRDGNAHPLWECATPHHLYVDEVLPHVVEFLFSNPDAAGCGYLKISDVAVNKWFDQAYVELRAGAKLNIVVVPEFRFELFLSPQGVGVLSLSLAPHARTGILNLSTDNALDLNYQLAQFRRQPVTRIRKHHPKDDTLRWDRMPAEARDRIARAPNDDEPLDKRLESSGGSFDLRELIEKLLRPLVRHGLRPVLRDPTDPGAHKELLVHTVVRLPRVADFGDKFFHSLYAPFLSRLSQVEESSHVGPPPGVVTTTNDLLNSRHWAAVGLLGSAHLVSDQGVAFDEQRIAIVAHKYFIPFLMALIQRLVLNRAIQDAGGKSTFEPTEHAARLNEVRSDLLRFAIRGHFTQVSTRQALHLFYQLARGGLDVSDAWNEVRQAFAEIDAKNAVEHQKLIMAKQTDLAAKQAQAAHSMKKSLIEIKKVQQFLHMIEYFVVSVYFGHLWHMFAAENEPLQEWAHEILYLDKHWFVSLGVLIFAVLGIVVVIILNKCLRHDDSDDAVV